MSHKVLITFFSIIIVSSRFTLFAETQNEIPQKLQNFIEKIESKKDTLQGGAIAILHKGQVIYKTIFGNQKGKTGRPITSHTLFPLASVSKTVSAAAIALMVDRGALDLDKIFKLSYLKNPVSLRNILSHTTGYKFSGNTQIEQGLSRQKLLKKLENQKPQCKPGACYSYSNTIFSLVEEALNRKNLSLLSVIQQLRITLKTDGIQIVPIAPSLDIAYPHTKEKTKVKPLPFPPYYPKAAPAAAGIFASLDGMIEVFKLSFGYRPDLISQKTLDELYVPLTSNHDIDKWNMKWPCNRNKIESYYGLGWRVLRIKGRLSKDLIFHGGFISGTTPFIGFIPSEEIGIIFLINQQSRTPFESGIDLWGEFLT